VRYHVIEEIVGPPPIQIVALRSPSWRLTLRSHRRHCDRGLGQDGPVEAIVRSGTSAAMHAARCDASAAVAEHSADRRSAVTSSCRDVTDWVVSVSEADGVSEDHLGLVRESVGLA
jgi:hypothetical protein